MESCQPRGNLKRFTDEDLREALQNGIPAAEFARQVGVSRQAVAARVKQLRLTTAAVVTSPVESRRFVSRSIDAIGQLTRGLDKVNRLMDACDEWLRDAEDATKYDLSPRSNEIDVIYEVEVDTGERLVTQKRKKQLSELMVCLDDGRDADGARFCGAVKGEYRHADPRELVLKTVQEGRQTVGAAAELAKMLADAQSMQQWREVVLNAIGRSAPDVRDVIVGEIRSSLVLRGLLEGPAANWSEVN